MTPTPEQPQASTSPASLAWVPWLQAGVTAMLVVLFLVIVGKARQQSATIRQLQERVEGLENSRTLERSTGLEQQVRSAVERLQAVERNSARIDILSRETASLRAELARLLSPSGTPNGVPPRGDEPPLLPPLPPLKTPAPAN
jgi:hypothetical protein